MLGFVYGIIAGEGVIVVTARNAVVSTYIILPGLYRGVTLTGGGKLLIFFVSGQNNRIT